MSDGIKRDKQGIVVGYSPLSRKTIISLALFNVLLKDDPKAGERYDIAQPMPEPEIEEPILEAYAGVSARNARRLAKKKRK